MPTNVPRQRNSVLRSATLLAFLFSPAAVWADELPAAIAELQTKHESRFREQVQPLLAKYCFDCHGDDVQEAGVQLSVLNPDMVRGDDAERWHAALDMINSGFMPPDYMPQPTDEERKALVNWMTESIELAKEAKEGTSTAVIRRLTKAQYSHTLGELLQLPIDFGRNLPDDPKSEMGFTNSGETLFASPLHAEYFQAIAREALDKAIADGPRPKKRHYRVTLGRDVGKDGHAAVIGGYQSDPIDRRHVRVEILDDEGRPRTADTPEEEDELRAIEENIGVGMRGSSSDRYRVIDRGLVLYSALPHKEKAPKSWQGPSPNMKLLLRRCFPSEGPFVTRVVASRARYTDCNLSDRLTSLRSPEPAVKLADGSREPEVADDAIVLTAADCKRVDGMKAEGDTLRAEDITADASARFRFRLRKGGYFQVDLVRPTATDDAMPSVSLHIDQLSQHLRLDGDGEEAQGDHLVVTPLAHAHLSPGEHQVRIGGKFFVGFSHLVLTPLPDDHPVAASLAGEMARSEKKFQGRVPELQAFIGNRTDDGMEYAEYGAPQQVTTPYDQPQTFEFHGYLENLPIPILDEDEPGDLSNIMIVGVWNNHLVKESGDSGVPLVVHSIEFEGPHYPTWPPESHTSIFFDSPQFETDRKAYTREVISRFMQRAFRRAVSDEEVDRYYQFWLATRDQHQSYHEGVKETLVAVLCSPHFLYLAQGEMPAADETALAERLAYFLWNSPPDERLMQLAAEGKLRDRLPEEVDRMVADEKVERFIRGFAHEWLRLDRHEAMNVNVDVYPDFTRFVKRDMLLETHHFLLHVLRSDLSAMTLIDSDFAMLNQNLAEFYGVDGVEGAHFRPVPVTPDEHRGGLLSQGAILCGHSDGTQPHPIKRAVWLKEKILGSPPPPPPPNVPELDPETPGFESLTLKEQLELHRDKPSCVDCHKKIDPYGVVFEKFDAVGRFRQEAKGRPIDAQSELPDGTVVDGVEGVKRYILESQRDVFAHSLVEHMYAYAMGRDVSFADQSEIDAIVDHVKENDYRFQAVVDGIVQCHSFAGSDQPQMASAEAGETQ